MAMRAESVGDAFGERLAEVARVAEARERDRHQLRAGLALGDPARDLVHQRRAHWRAVAAHALGEVDAKAVLAEDFGDSLADLLLAEAGRDAAVDAQLGAAGYHIDLLRRTDACRRERHAEHGLEHDRQARVGGAYAGDRAGRVRGGRAPA